MNTKRILFWAGFIIVLVLIVWGLIVAMGKTPVVPGQNLGTPAPITANDNVFGPSDAPVTIVEYSDYQCPACQLYYFVLEKVFASSTVPIRFVYRHFPLGQHKNAINAAMAVEASGLQGKYWEMHKMVFENQSDWQDLGDASSIFASYAKELGLDLEKFKIDLGSTVLKDKIKASADEGLKIGIDSTPTFFINGKSITNPASYDEFKSIIEKSAQENIK
jgi:protein-disulfide isomerase